MREGSFAIIVCQWETGIEKDVCRFDELLGKNKTKPVQCMGGYEEKIFWQLFAIATDKGALDKQCIPVSKRKKINQKSYVSRQSVLPHTAAKCDCICLTFNLVETKKIDTHSFIVSLGQLLGWHIETCILVRGFCNQIERGLQASHWHEVILQYKGGPLFVAPHFWCAMLLYFDFLIFVVPECPSCLTRHNIERKWGGRKQAEPQRDGPRLGRWCWWPSHCYKHLVCFFCNKKGSRMSSKLAYVVAWRNWSWQSHAFPPRQAGCPSTLTHHAPSCPTGI